MSHFSTIKTKIKDKEALLEALEMLNYEVEVDKTLENPANHQHEEVCAKITLGSSEGVGRITR